MTDLAEPLLLRSIERAEANLQRQLEWVGRHDARSSFVTGISIAMLGYLATVTPAMDRWTVWLVASFLTAVALLLASLVCIYLGQYPKTKSQNASLLFFDTISGLHFDEYRRRFIGMTDEAYLEDLLSQSHTNAGILRTKFRALKGTLIFILLSVPPWAIATYLSKLLST